MSPEAGLGGSPLKGVPATYSGAINRQLVGVGIQATERRSKQPHFEATNPLQYYMGHVPRCGSGIADAEPWVAPRSATGRGARLKPVSGYAGNWRVHEEDTEDRARKVALARSASSPATSPKYSPPASAPVTVEHWPPRDDRRRKYKAVHDILPIRSKELQDQQAMTDTTIGTLIDRDKTRIDAQLFGNMSRSLRNSLGDMVNEGLLRQQAAASPVVPMWTKVDHRRSVNSIPGYSGHKPGYRNVSNPNTVGAASAANWWAKYSAFAHLPAGTPTTPNTLPPGPGNLVGF